MPVAIIFIGSLHWGRSVMLEFFCDGGGGLNFSVMGRGGYSAGLDALLRPPPPSPTIHLMHIMVQPALDAE